MSVHFDKMIQDNFGCIGHAEVDLGEPGIVFVTGSNKDSDAAESNGSGKTTLLEGLPWCLYGKTIRGDKGDAVIKRGKKKARVSVPVRRDGGESYTVVRTRSKGSEKLELIDKDGDQLPMSKGDKQEVIENLIGMDFESFRNTVFYGQNDTSRFADPMTTDGERKGMLRRLLKTTIYQDCYEQARARKLEVVKDRDGWDAKGQAVASRMDEYGLEAMEKLRDDWTEGRASLIAEIIAEATAHKDKARELAPDNARLEELTADRDTADDKAKEWTGEAREGELREEHEGVQRELHEASRSISSYAIKREGLEEELARLSAGSCPVCTSPLDGEIPEQHKDKLRKGIEAVSAVWAVDGQKVDELKDKLTRLKDELRAAVREADAHDEVSKGLVKLDSAIAMERQVQDGIQGQVDREVELARRALERAKEAKAETNPHDARLQEARDRIEELRSQSNDIQRKITALDGDAAHLEFWVRGFGPQGLPSLLLDSCMPVLTERANHYLKTLADGDITVEFTTQRELKTSKGEMRDEIQINRTIEGHEGVMPSGGQLKKISIAVDLALMDLASMREGEGVALLALDEVLDGLDGEGRARVLLLLKELRSARGTVLVVSHSTDVSPVFERTLIVEKVDGEATVREAA